MDILVLILVAANLVAVAVAAAVLFTRFTSQKKELEDLRATVQQQQLFVREEQTQQRQELKTTINDMRGLLEERIRTGSESQLNELARERTERAASLKEINELLDKSLNKNLADTLKVSLDENAERVRGLTESNATKQEELRRSLQRELEKLRTGNEEKLEKMRATVDEKLQGTLEKRLGESFALVSDRLEKVQKGLGEMQTLATDVGGLKQVLTNVKSRGGWGETQLARHLEDMLSPDQYEENVAVVPGSAERVEFAIKLPGKGEYDTPVYLPIDSKFPQEDYERLLTAQDAGDKEQVDEHTKKLEKVLIEQAKIISRKYVVPPHTTDFAIMYLPTEGLFAEAVRRPGLTSRLQREERILVTGPSTLMSILNSLQMGFRTLAIEKRSSEVWQVLGAAKLEFEKYAVVWERLEKQLGTVQNTVRDAGTRTRALQRKLKNVESVPSAKVDLGITEMSEDLEELELSEREDTGA